MVGARLAGKTGVRAGRSQVVVLDGSSDRTIAAIGLNVDTDIPGDIERRGAINHGDGGWDIAGCIYDGACVLHGENVML